MFHVGQKVVCVNAKDQEIFLVKGNVYTIQNIRDGYIVITLPDTGGHFAWRFRPTVERKTDISVFTEMLTPTPQKVRESIGYDLGFTREQIGAA